MVLRDTFGLIRLLKQPLSSSSRRVLWLLTLTDAVIGATLLIFTRCKTCGNLLRVTLDLVVSTFIVVVVVVVVPNIVKERVSNKASWKYFCSSEKNGRQKPFRTGIDQGRNRCLSRKYYPGNTKEELLILEFLIRRLFYTGLLHIQRTLVE